MLPKQFMDIVEKKAMTNGFNRVQLVSSITAHEFYMGIGYQDDVVGKLGIDMHKELT